MRSLVASLLSGRVREGLSKAHPDSRGSGRAVALPGNVVFDNFYHCCAPLGGGSRGGLHSVVLDVTVRTDTFSGVQGGSRGCIVPVCCDFCGLPLKRCRCLVGVDY